MADVFAVQNSLMTPTALAVGEAPAANISKQKWLLQLTGVLIPNLQGTGEDWLRSTLKFFPDIRPPLRQTISHYSIPRPPGTEDNNYILSFEVERETIFAAPSSILARGTPVNAGFAVDAWRPGPLGTGSDAFTSAPVSNLISFIEVDVAVRNSKSTLHRISYNITVLGKIRFVAKTF